MRNSIVLMDMFINNKKHFKLVGQDMWIPYYGELFIAVEAYMVINKLAHNVVDICYVRRCGSCTDYEVIYNEIKE